MQRLLLFCFVGLIACQGNVSPPEHSTAPLGPDSASLERSIPDDIEPELLEIAVLEADTSDLEFQLIQQGLINVQGLDPNIHVDLKYSTTDNFLQEDVYGDLENCYLQPEVAEMLSKAQQMLKSEDSSLNLVIFDGVRPRSVQLKMWEIVKGTPQQDYVAPPGSGSMHNYGAAVDLGLIDEKGELVDMGTPFDHFGPLAQPRYETKYLKSGELSNEQAQNRWLLRKVMKAAGFHVILSEWWHFNAFDRQETRKKYQIVD